MMQGEPMAQPNMFPARFPVQTQVVGQTGVIPLQTISTNRVVNRHSQHPQLVGVGIPQIVIRVICSVSPVCFILVVTLYTTRLNLSHQHSDTICTLCYNLCGLE